MSNESLLRKIKAARILKGIKQEDIAKKLNISNPTYSRFERGITKTDYNLATKICSILELDLYHLENTSHQNLLEEDSTSYEISQNIDKKSNLEISTQIKILITLLEKQQKINQLILKKLKSLT